MAGSKVVWQDSGGIWLAATLAAQKSGLTKPELHRRADAGQLQFRDDLPGKHYWFAEPQIAALAREKLAAERSAPVRAKRTLTDSQLEARHTRKWEKEVEKSRTRPRIEGQSHPGSVGPVAAHMERMMVHETFALADRNKSKKPE